MAIKFPGILCYLPDLRQQTRNKLHKLEDIMMITMCVGLGRYENWGSIEDFGYENEAWLHHFLELINEIPSHDKLSGAIIVVQ
ncbi:MAG: transposase family protein [Glaciimonas sp.]|nr:transposase family protein [Glaciimonas sp.]